MTDTKFLLTRITLIGLTGGVPITRILCSMLHADGVVVLQCISADLGVPLTESDCAPLRISFQLAQRVTDRVHLSHACCGIVSRDLYVEEMAQANAGWHGRQHWEEEIPRPITGKWDVQARFRGTTRSPTAGHKFLAGRGMLARNRRLARACSDATNHDYHSLATLELCRGHRTNRPPKPGHVHQHRRRRATGQPIPGQREHMERAQRHEPPEERGRHYRLGTRGGTRQTRLAGKCTHQRRSDAAAARNIHGSTHRLLHCNPKGSYLCTTAGARLQSVSTRLGTNGPPAANRTTTPQHAAGTSIAAAIRTDHNPARFSLPTPPRRSTWQGPKTPSTRPCRHGT